MIRALIDQMIDFRLTSVVLVLTHIGALIWGLRSRGGIVPVLALNLVIATGILAYNAPHFALLIANADTAPLAMTVFALVNLLTSAAALARLRVPSAIVWALFGVDFALSVLLMAFLITFKMTRLF
jgi:hypothetical protein